MLNGIGAMKSITLAAPTTLGLMFVDADSAFNSGQGTVTLDSGGTTATVDAVANVLRWNEGCITTPAMLLSFSMRSCCSRLSDSELRRCSLSVAVTSRFRRPAWRL